MTRVLTDLDLLEAWTETRGETSAERAEALLARAVPAHDRGAIAAWPLARRNAALLELRMSRWSDSLDAVTSCPHCGEDLELSLDLGEIVAHGSGEAPNLVVETAEGPVTFRLPAPPDLEAVASYGDPDAARRALAESCVVSAPEGLSELRDDTIEAMSELMAGADPVGALTVELSCPSCGQSWAEPLDLVDFIADEAATEARRIAAEVHVLAASYGWSEADVLELPATRRRLYLELVEQ
jgi:hypothetical protein